MNDGLLENQKAKNQYQLLLQLIAMNEDIDIIKKSVCDLKNLKTGMDLLNYAVNENGLTLLCVVSKSIPSQLELVSFLLEAGVYQHVPSHFRGGWEILHLCPIHIAIGTKNHDLLKVLIKHSSFGNFKRYAFERKTLAQISLTECLQSFKILYDHFGIEFLEEEINGHDAYFSALYIAGRRNNFIYLNCILENLKITSKIYSQLDKLISFYSGKDRELLEPLKSYIAKNTCHPLQALIVDVSPPEPDLPDRFIKFKKTQAFPSQVPLDCSYRFLAKRTLSEPSSKKRKNLSGEDTAVLEDISDPGTEVFIDEASEQEALSKHQNFT